MNELLGLIKALSIIGLVVGIALLYSGATLLIGMLVTIDEKDFGLMFFIAWFVSVIAFVIVSMMLLDAKGYINVNESSVNTEIVEETIDD